MKHENGHAATIELGIASAGMRARDCLAILSTAERDRYHTMKHARRAREYAASRWLLRSLLGEILGQDPATVALVTPPDRAPYVAGSSITVGLSHSHGLCVVAVTDHGRFGCDIERARPRRRMHALAAGYFHPDEAAQLERFDADNGGDAFYRLWTLKEAALKARERGIADGLDWPAFTDIANQPKIRAEHRPSDWVFATATRAGARGDVHLSLAADRPMAELRCRFFRARGGHATTRSMHWPWQFIA